MITIREGSSLYYSLLWTEPVAKQRFIDRLNLVQALATILDDVQESQIAEKKIHWWHEELQRMFDGTSRHPATQACQESLALHSNDVAKPDNGEPHPAISACLAILGSISTKRFTPPATVQAAQNLQVQDYTGRLALTCHALSQDTGDLALDSHLPHVASALAKHEQLVRLPALLHRGQPVFSEETYQQHHIRPDDLASLIRVADASDASAKPGAETLAGIKVSIEKPGCKRLLSWAISDTHATLIKAAADSHTATRYRHKPLTPIWRLLILREKQLALWACTQPNLLRERSTLTPLRKFITAWRYRR